MISHEYEVILADFHSTLRQPSSEDLDASAANLDQLALVKAGHTARKLGCNLARLAARDIHPHDSSFAAATSGSLLEHLDATANQEASEASYIEPMENAAYLASLVRSYIHLSTGDDSAEKADEQPAHDINGLAQQWRRYDAGGSYRMSRTATLGNNVAVNFAASFADAVQQVGYDSLDFAEKKWTETEGDIDEDALEHFTSFSLLAALSSTAAYEEELESLLTVYNVEGSAADKLATIRKSAFTRLTDEGMLTDNPALISAHFGNPVTRAVPVISIAPHRAAELGVKYLGRDEA